jgi:hypothetical protein
LRRATTCWLQSAALGSAVLATVVWAGERGPAAQQPAVSCRTEARGASDRLLIPYGVTSSPAGPVIADAGSGRVFRARPSGRLSIVAGTGEAGFSGDGEPAVEAQLQYPTGITRTADGGFLVADNGNHRIRRISPALQITTVAGVGTVGFSGDGGPATAAELAYPGGVAPTRSGGFLVADTGNHRVRRVSPSGRIKTVAGVGNKGFSGDGGPADRAELDSPTDLAVTKRGLLIADSGNHRIRRVSNSGRITTVAGTGTQGFSGDGGPATVAELHSPADVAPLASGGFLIADTGNARIRRVSRRGVISTVAGTRSPGFSGDGRPATAAQLASPSGVTAQRGRGILIADTGNNRIRRVSRSGIISTVGGCGDAPSTRPNVRRVFSSLSLPSRSDWRFGLYRKPVRARPGRRIRVRYLTTHKARVVVVVKKRRKTRRRAAELAAASIDLVRLPSLPSGRYALRVRAESGGMKKRDRTTLRVR